MVNPTVAAVFPDGAPPPPPPPPPCDTLSSIIFTILFCIIFSLCAFPFVFLIIELTRPVSSHPNHHLNSVSLTPLNDLAAAAANFTAKFDMTFTFTNPNTKYDINYEILVASLDDTGDCDRPSDYEPNSCSGLLGLTRLPPFVQLNRSENTIPVQIDVVGQFLGNRIVAARAVGVSIEFGLKLYARYSTAVDGYTMNFYCNRLSFGFQSNNASSASG